MKLEGTVAVVTGASSGIGEATARILSARGCKVILLARYRGRLQKIVSEIRAQGEKADCYQVDLSDVDAVTSCAIRLIQDQGDPDILINNAGAGRWLPITLTTSEEAARMMSVPYLAAFNLTRELLGGMLKRSKGHIVNVTSVASRLAWPKAVAYIAARRAMEGFNAALRADLYGSGIGVTLAVFGTVDSPYWDHNPGSREYLPKRAAGIRALTPDAAGEAIVTAIERNRSIIIKPAIFRLFFSLNELFPTQTEAMMCS